MQATISNAHFTLVVGPQPDKAPEQVARELRLLVEDRVPKTRADYFAEDGPCAPDNRVNALWVETAIHNATGRTGQEVEDIAVLVFPELYATYWDNLM
jgi:hypothetical protein